MGFALKKPEHVAGSAAPAIIVGLFVAFGGVLFGYDTGIIGGIIAMRFWKDLFSTGYINPKNGLPDVDANQISEIVSILSAGTFLGALLAAPTADHLGRRWAMIFDSLVFVFGVILQTVATDIPIFVAGRFFSGLGIGLMSATISVYQSETSPKWIRGTIVGCYQFAIAVGLLLAAIVLNITKNRNDTGSYRIPVAIQFGWAFILVVGMLILPETPRFLIKQGRQDLAARSLSRLRRLNVDHPALVMELAEIKANHDYEMALGSASYVDCFRSPLRKRLLTGCALQALQPLTGVNFVFYYGTSFFENSGISNPFIISTITDVVFVCSIFPGLYMVEKWGRRPLLMFGAVGMCVCQIIVASVDTALNNKNGNQTSNKILIAFVCLYIFFFGSSWGPVVWVVTGEIFPLKARAKCFSMTTATNWLMNWAIAYATPYLVNDGPGNANLGAKVFYIWGGVCLVCMALVYFAVYETQGLSLEQIDELYGKVNKAWSSRSFVPTISFAEVDLDRDVKSTTLTELEAEVEKKRADVHVDENAMLAKF